MPPKKKVYNFPMWSEREVELISLAFHSGMKKADIERWWLSLVKIGEVTERTYSSLYHKNKSLSAFNLSTPLPPTRGASLKTPVRNLHSLGKFEFKITKLNLRYTNH
jgi:hypothetical protein